MSAVLEKCANEWELHLDAADPKPGKQLDVWFRFRRRGVVETIEIDEDGQDAGVTLVMRDGSRVAAVRIGERWLSARDFDEFGMIQS